MPAEQRRVVEKGGEELAGRHAGEKIVEGAAGAAQVGKELAAEIAWVVAQEWPDSP